MTDITFDGAPTVEEARKVQRLGVPRLIVWLAPLFLLSVCLDLWTDGLEHPLQFLLRLGLAVWISLLIFPRFGSQFSAALLRARVSGRISEKGITWSVAHKTTTLPWWGFVCRRENEDVLVLLNGPKSVYISKRMMQSPQDWQHARSCILSMVPRGHMLLHLFQ